MPAISGAPVPGCLPHLPARLFLALSEARHSKPGKVRAPVGPLPTEALDASWGVRVVEKRSSMRLPPPGQKRLED